MADFCVAITGGIASGKTAVAEAFARLGRPVVDADQVARDLVQPGAPALEDIRARFGSAALTAEGVLDRGWLRTHVFADPDARRALEAILHPRVRAALQHQAAQASGAYVLVAVPLLAEGGGRTAYPWLQRILLVDVPESLQLARLQARDGSSRDLAERMLGAQARRSERLAIADDVIVNDGPLPGLTAMVARLDRRYLAAAGARAAPH